MKIFITGGTGGIGSELAKRYLEEGHTVGVCGGDLSIFNQAFPKGIKNLFFYDVDVRDRAFLKRAVTEFSQGELDIMVAGAGINDGVPDTGVDIDFDRSEKIIDINFKGVMNAFEAAFSLMKERREGHLVAISSVAGIVGFPAAPAYVASKGGVNLLCESLKIRLKCHNISVTNILPGYVDTSMARATQKDIECKKSTLTPELASIIIKKAIEKRSGRVIFPFKLKVISSILCSLPRSWFVALISQFYKGDKIFEKNYGTKGQTDAK